MTEQEEKHIMQLAAISTASVQNTESTIKDRIETGHDYWTVAYADVCKAVDREMRERRKVMVLRSAILTLADIKENEIENFSKVLKVMPPSDAGNRASVAIAALQETV